MKTPKQFRFKAAPFLLCALFAALLSCAGSPSGAAPSSGAAVPSGAGRGRLLRTEPAEAPAWVSELPESSDTLGFVGTSREMSSVTDARGGARNDAVNQIAQFYGTYIKSNLSMRSRYAQSGGAGESSETVDEELAVYAGAFVNQVNAESYFTEIYAGQDGAELYVVHALYNIPRQKAEEDARNFAAEISDRYTNIIINTESLQTVLSSSVRVLAELEKNPLHRAVAYRETRTGKASLYDYLMANMNETANSVSFSPVASTVKQSAESLDMKLKLSSPSVKRIGSLDVRVTMPGGRQESRVVAADDTITLHVDTESFQRGKYTLDFELLLKGEYPNIENNPEGSYSFEITQAMVSLEFEGAQLSARERATLTESVQQGVQRNGAQVRISAADSSAQAGNRFVILVNYNTGTRKAAPPFPVDMHYCDVSLALLRNGTMVLQSDKQSFSEISRDRLIGMAAEAVRGSRSFFQGIARSLD